MEFMSKARLYKRAYEMVAVGKIYTFRYQTRVAKENVIHQLRLRCIKKHSHLILFEDAKGIKYSLQPYDVYYGLTGKCIELKKGGDIGGQD